MTASSIQANATWITLPFDLSRDVGGSPESAPTGFYLLLIIVTWALLSCQRFRTLIVTSL